MLIASEFRNAGRVVVLRERAPTRVRRLGSDLLRDLLEDRRQRLVERDIAGRRLGPGLALRAELAVDLALVGEDVVEQLDRLDLLLLRRLAGQYERRTRRAREVVAGEVRAVRPGQRRYGVVLLVPSVRRTGRDEDARVQHGRGAEDDRSGVIALLLQGVRVLGEGALVDQAFLVERIQVLQAVPPAILVRLDVDLAVVQYQCRVVVRRWCPAGRR